MFPQIEFYARNCLKCWNPLRWVDMLRRLDLCERCRQPRTLAEVLNGSR